MDTSFAVPFLSAAMKSYYRLCLVSAVSFCIMQTTKKPYELGKSLLCTVEVTEMHSLKINELQLPIIMLTFNFYMLKSEMFY